ncbi:MAG: LysM peptidoglycan-binding domain-containing protein [Verrucomicrobia bacterium]|nr:LysM peptidoglycan-binding domain-containing protein [Verrucomicrobiota bacterium]
MRSPRLSPYLAPLAVLALSGCGYVHVGKLPAPVTTVVGDEKLLKENSDLRAEKKILQQELALTRAQGDALRSAIENRAADGDTSRRLADRLTETTRELAALRTSYAQLQTQRAATAANPAEIADLKSQLAGTEEKLAASLRNFTQLQEEIGGLRTEVAKTRTENLALTEQVKVVSAKSAEVQLALAQVNAELLVQKESRTRAEQDATTLRTQLESANGRLSELAQQRTASAAEAKSLAPSDGETKELRTQLESLRQKVTALEAERSTLQQQLAAKAGAADAKVLADTQAQLIAALNGAKMLRDENDQLKSTTTELTRAKTDLEGELAKARTAAPLAAQAQTLRDQLTQTQAQASALLEENAQLKSRLAAGAAGGSPAPRTLVTTTSGAPAPAAPTAPTTPRPVSSPVTANFVVTTPGGGAPAASITRSSSSAPRYHTVASGDTLSKISSIYYGTPGRWAEILVANRDVLGEDNNLVIGRQLRIP